VVTGKLLTLFGEQVWSATKRPHHPSLRPNLISEHTTARSRSMTAKLARISPAMTKAQQQEAAEVLKRVVERIDQGEVDAPGWLRERLVGALLALDAGRGGASPSRWRPIPRITTVL
jgi:hypothetical protein